MKKIERRLVSMACLLLCLACGCAEAQDDPKPKTEPKQQTTAPAKEKMPDKLNASHILVSHKDARSSSSDRTKEEALKRAQEIVVKARAKDADFAALAKELSDGPSGAQGGDLGNFPPDRMIPAFSAATAKLEIGKISEPVETDFGFHVILRKKLLEDLSAAHILVMHTKSERVPPNIKRTKEEALQLATKLAKEAQEAGPKGFAALAKEHSDGPSGPKGGDLGVFAPNQMVPEFSKATAALKVGGISGPVESPFGYHIILRKALPKKASARHILVQWEGSSRADGITRTKEEAMARIKECIEKHKNGEDFAALAKEYSDGPSGPRGGDLGSFGEGQMVPAFDEALFKLKVDEVSGIVETQFGYHFILRYK